MCQWRVNNNPWAGCWMGPSPIIIPLNESDKKSKKKKNKAMVTCAILICKNCTCNHSFRQQETQQLIVCSALTTSGLGLWRPIQRGRRRGQLWCKISNWGSKRLFSYWTRSLRCGLTNKQQVRGPWRKLQVCNLSTAASQWMARSKMYTFLVNDRTPPLNFQTVSSSLLGKLINLCGLEWSRLFNYNHRTPWETDWWVTRTNHHQSR